VKEIFFHLYIFLRFFTIFVIQFEAIHNKDYSVVKTFKVALTQVKVAFFIPWQAKTAYQAKRMPSSQISNASIL